MKKLTNNDFRILKITKRQGFRIILYLAFASFALYYCTQLEIKDHDHFASEANLSPISQATILYEPYIQFFSYIVKKGDTFAGILSKFNISENEAVQYYTSLKSIGFSTLFPGDSLCFTKDGNKQVKSFSLLNRLSYWYHLHTSDSTLQVEKKPLEVTTYRCLVKGTLESSLSEDMWKYGVGDALVIKMADIFAWDINFFMDPRKGDTFEVLFEKNYRDGRFVGYGSILAAQYINGNKIFYAIALKDSRGKLNYYDLNGKSVQKQFLKAPLRFNRISSGFSYSRKHPILGIYRPHLGIDYAAPRGTPVYAAADGKVTFTGVNGNYGRQVKLSHGASYQTFYGHLYTIGRGIRPGVHVSQGQCIGTVGKTGLATGYHLDYRMKIGSRFVNPVTISLPSKEGVPEGERAQFEHTKQTYLSMMHMRMNHHGCIVIDIIQPDADKPVVSKTTTIESNDGNTTSS